MSHICEEIQKKLYEEGADALSAQELCHIEECDECKKEKAELETALSLLKEAMPRAVKDGRSCSQQILQKINSGKISQKKHTFRFPYATVAAAAIILFVFSITQTGVLDVLKFGKAANEAMPLSAGTDNGAAYDMSVDTADTVGYIAESATGSSASAALFDGFSDNMRAEADIKKSTDGAEAEPESEMVAEDEELLEFKEYVKLINEKYSAELSFELASTVSLERFKEWVNGLETQAEYNEENFRQYFKN